MIERPRIGPYPGGSIPGRRRQQVAVGLKLGVNALALVSLQPGKLLAIRKIEYRYCPVVSDRQQRRRCD